MSWEWGLDLRILYISSRGKKISYEADMGLKSPLGENNWVDPKAWSMQIRKLLPHPWNLPPFSFSFCELRHGSSYRRLWSRQLLQLPWHEIDVRDRWPVWTRTTLLVALELWKNARHRNTCLNSSRLSLQLIGAYISQAFGIQFAQEKARYLGVPRHHNSELMWTNRSARQMVFLFQKYSGPHVEHVTGSWHRVENSDAATFYVTSKMWLRIYLSIEHPRTWRKSHHVHWWSVYDENPIMSIGGVFICPKI